MLEPLIALLVEQRRFTLRILELVSGISPAPSGTLCACQQHGKTQHRHCADRDPGQEHRAGRPCDVIAQEREVLGQRVGGSRVGEHAGESCDHRHEQYD